MSALQPATPPAAASGWSERWARQVDRWMTSPALGRWAGRSVFTRWLVRRRSRELFDLMAGFVHSQVLLGCVRLQLFERLAQRPHTLEEIAARKALRPYSIVEEAAQNAVAPRGFARALSEAASTGYGLAAQGTINMDIAISYHFGPGTYGTFYHQIGAFGVHLLA